ncbi:hypothetical protein E2C01_055970 [Portunus trituberculatus]|uniref:Uncharacterized protein n=1 Tax=Portunus trituberculatus TaxID=210409 RepID=A0A5B7GW61_PORTR|nr:hypothetical protein [Portunus trituberculatus]
MLEKRPLTQLLHLDLPHSDSPRGLNVETRGRNCASQVTALLDLSIPLATPGRSMRLTRDAAAAAAILVSSDAITQRQNGRWEHT